MASSMVTMPVVARCAAQARSTKAARASAVKPVKATTLSARSSVARAAALRSQRRVTRAVRSVGQVMALDVDVPPQLEIDPNDPSSYTLGILGDLHIDPRDTADSLEGREHVKALLKGAPNPFLVSLGDLGESKDCTETKQLYSGTTPCFEFVREFLDGFEVPYDIVGGNHDLEGIDEFQTDEENLEAYLRILGKDTPQFCHEIAEKTLVVGMGSTSFRTAPYTSHEVSIDLEQIDWFENVITSHPASEGWKIFVFSHAPIIGSALRVLQENHVVNGCCWLNHNDAVQSKRFINIVRNNASIKGWFSGHFHLSHDYEDSITFPQGNNRGSCIFAQTGVMTSRSSRDGRRHTRFVRGNADGFEVCTVDHKKGGVLRLDATVTFEDNCIVDEESMGSGESACSTVVFAHKHEDYDHDKWFSAYVPSDGDGCQIIEPKGEVVKNEELEQVCWWHMKDGTTLGVHNGMIIEYDPSTLAPLGMVVSRDELKNRRVAVIDDEFGGNALVLYDDDTNKVTVVQPNEDGSYWRKVVRNKMHRMREMRRVAAAKKWIKEKHITDDTEPEVLSSYGPYTSTAGNVMGLSTRAINPKAKSLDKAQA
mmetsp:Transcript_35445/g.66818  ORF Transcript_35445/g.66818 Transcript_35445/m.66818 type:complete len:595 (+) Transcript_35445:79-1863(+)